MQGPLTSHVDDFLQAGSPVFEKLVAKKMKEKFMLSREEELEFRYVGINMKQNLNCLAIDQEHYIKNLQPIPVPDTVVGEPNVKQFRRLVGSLNWASIISRPDISFDVVDLSTRFPAPSLEDFVKANKVVKRVQSIPVGINYPKLCLDSRLRIVVFSDGSFRNLCDGVSSGSGWIVFLVDGVLNCCVISWASKKLQREVDSTSAVESLALSNAVKEALYIKMVMQELLPREVCLPIYAITDRKGIHQAVHSTKLVDDKTT